MAVRKTLLPFKPYFPAVFFFLTFDDIVFPPGRVGWTLIAIPFPQALASHLRTVRLDNYAYTDFLNMAPPHRPSFSVSVLQPKKKKKRHKRK